MGGYDVIFDQIILLFPGHSAWAMNNRKLRPIINVRLESNDIYEKLRCLLENQKTSCSHKGSHTIFRVLGKKIILNIKRLLSILYYSNTKIYLKKKRKRFAHLD